MWRGQEADLTRQLAVSLVLGEDGGDKGAYAAFAFGAGYVNDIETIEIIGLIDTVSKS